MKITTNHDADRPENENGSINLAALFDTSQTEIFFDEQETGTSCYIICFVDIVSSTQITAQIGVPDKIGKYYSIFLNAMAALAKNFGAKVIKNVGDALIFYFPQTSDSNNGIAFKEAFECFNAIIAARDLINSRLTLESLPEVSYRISADYGQVEVGRTVSSGAEDLFGTTVNICSKINVMAEKNGIIIGSDLYQVVKRFSFEAEFEFRETDSFRMGFKQSYPLYSVKYNTKNPPLPDANVLLPALKKHTPLGSNIGIGILQIAPKIRKQTVMVVDDEPDVLVTLRSFLVRDGKYDVEAFSDSYGALQAFAKSEPGHFDLIILDIRMPSMNGIQLYKRLKAIDPHAKIIFLTALDASDELLSVLQGLRSIDIMKKPLGQTNFLQRVEASIRDLPSTVSADPQAI